MGSHGVLRVLPAPPQQPASAVAVLRLAVADAAQESGRRAEVTLPAAASELPDGTRFNRAPNDMRSWEIQATYRLAWHLACFLPRAGLAQALANWLCAAQRELERRGEWQPEALPPHSM
jgi:hypothetical protein